VLCRKCGYSGIYGLDRKWVQLDVGAGSRPPVIRMPVVTMRIAPQQARLPEPFDALRQLRPQPFQLAAGSTEAIIVDPGGLEQPVVHEGITWTKPLDQHSLVRTASPSPDQAEFEGERRGRQDPRLLTVQQTH
jgi:hypothetical protein